tara:strand:- start:1608 stop:1925 length:318 start_codon:yes stop_codon:yes gene_type:complete
METMTNEQIEFTLSVEHYLHTFRKTQVMRMTAEETIKVKTVYHEVMGSHIPNCSSCFIEHFTSLIIRAKALKEQQIPTYDDLQIKAIELAQIADDEQKIKSIKKK